MCTAEAAAFVVCQCTRRCQTGAVTARDLPALSPLHWQRVRPGQNTGLTHSLTRPHGVRIFHFASYLHLHLHLQTRR